MTLSSRLDAYVLDWEIEREIIPISQCESHTQKRRHQLLFHYSSSKKMMTIFNEETFSLKSGLQKGPRHILMYILFS